MHFHSHSSTVSNVHEDRLRIRPLPRLSGAGGVRCLAVLLALLGLGQPAPLGAATPRISEFMADNRTTLADEDGEFNDWIEVANPGATPLDLAGYWLTDDADRPARWMFPAVTLPAGGHLVVFASGKNRRVPGARLHTDFRLDVDGEYLALVAPDGRTVVDAYAPAYPPQDPDVSFGRPPAEATRDLLAGAPLAIRVPTPAQPLEPDWNQPGFLAGPGSGWTPALGLGVGYDSGFGAGLDGNLARNGVASQSSTSGFAPGLAIDGNLATFTHTTSDDPRSAWTVDLGREFELIRVVLHNRGDCCQSRLRDITVVFLAADGTTVRWRSPLLNPENTLDGPARLEVDLFELEVGPVTARYVRVERTPDPDLSGSGGQGNADEDNVLTLSEVEIEGVDALTYAPLILTDVGNALRGTGAALAARVEFAAGSDLAAAAPPTLRVRYDDGFVAWLNGRPVARANAPAEPTGESRATAAHPDAQAVVFAEFALPADALLPGTNVLALLGLNVAPDDDDFLLDARIEVTGTYSPPPAYFEHPTPGAPNTGDWHLGRLPEPRFSVERGFADQPFTLELSLPTTAAASLVYTLDGSEPTTTHGTLYQAPLRIDRTTVVRARTLRPDYRASDIVTHTYLFPADILRQPANPAGFPARWADVAADYQMDPTITQSAAYASRLTASLRALPSVSFSTDVNGLFGSSQGIYANPENRGPTWERPVSMEWIEPDGGRRFQADAGLRIQGGYFRQRGATRKHSLRVLFKDEYGPGRLRRDVFEQFGATREFDGLVFRAGANDGYTWDGARDTEQFLRDEFGRRLALAMGQPAPHGRFVHVYLNGLYWGLYNLCERPNEDFAATYLGGDPTEWDAINSGEVKAGDFTAWNRFLADVRATTTVPALLRLQGLAPDGRRDPALPVYLALDHYADYMLLNIWGGNWDWPNKNFWFARRRTAESTGFQFFLWDFENTMGNNRDRSPLQMVSPRAGITEEWVAAPHARLKSLPEYQLRFGDRVHRHLLGDGPLTPNALVTRYRALADNLELAVIAETARWGDDHFKPPQDLGDWQRERDWLLGNYLPQRTDVVLGQLRAAGLYPAVTAPQVVTSNTPAGAPAPVVIRTPARWLYYTVDGTDPRLPGGAPNPAAQRAEFASEVGVGSGSPVLVAPDAVWKYWDTGTDPGLTWLQLNHGDGGWFSGPAQLGYGDGDEATVVRSIDTDPTQAGVQRNATTYFRTTFVTADPAAYRSLDLEVVYDDAVAVYLNGRDILRTDNLPLMADYRTFATADRSDNSVETRIGLDPALLRAGTNILAAEVHQRSAASTDLSFGLRLAANPRTGVDPTAPWNSTPLVLDRPTRILARSWNGTAWSALTDVRVAPGAATPDSRSLVISEIAYRPPDATTPAEFAVSADRDDFEFVELLNTGTRPIDLSKVRLAGGVEFDLGLATDPATVLAPGARVLVVANRAAFEARYGTGLPVAGEFRGQLGNDGDTLRLETATGTVLQRLAWSPSAPWPSASATNGASLVLLNPESAPDPANPAHWRASLQPGGTPGTSDTIRFTGQPDADADGNGRVDLVDYALGDAAGDLVISIDPPASPAPPAAPSSLRLAHPRRPGADDVRIAIETAASAVGPWLPADDGLVYLGTRPEPAGWEWVEYQAPMPASNSTARFFRLVVRR